jgi:hypothetical protein
MILRINLIALVPATLAHVAAAFIVQRNGYILHHPRFQNFMITDPSRNDDANVVDGTYGIDGMRPERSPQSDNIRQPPSLQPLPIYARSIDQTPDRAISIVSELKANAALFAAFAYGGLSLPGILTVTESKVTSVTSSVSITRPLPSSDLVDAFVVLDTVTLCLMISCVAASQLLLYRLTDGSWTEEEDCDSQNANDTTNASALSRLVNDSRYRTEFTVARTTFDLGLVALLLAVGVRTTAMYEASISGPISILLLTTCGLLGTAYLQSYWGVFRRLAKNDSIDRWLAAPPLLLVVAVAAVFWNYNDAGVNSVDSSGSASPATSKTDSSSKPSISERLEIYSNAAGQGKLKAAVDKISEEKETRKAASISAKRSRKVKEADTKDVATATKDEDTTTVRKKLKKPAGDTAKPPSTTIDGSGATSKASDNEVLTSSNEPEIENAQR